MEYRRVDVQVLLGIDIQYSDTVNKQVCGSVAPLTGGVLRSGTLDFGEKSRKTKIEASRTRFQE